MSLPDSDNEVTARRLSAVLTGLFSKISTALNLKADKVANATNGHFAALDANGNLTDSGKNTADFATAAQGANADSAIQGVKVNGTDLSKDGNNVVDVPVPTASTATPLKDGTASAGSSSQWARGDHVHPTDDSREAVSNKKQVVNDSSTTEYPSSKAVADFVNSSVATNTANFLGTISESYLGLDYTATNAQIALALNVHSWESTPTNNDYCFVSVNDPQTTDVDEYRRFKFNGSVWAYEYTLNNSSFTQPQWDAINSGLTSSDRTAYNAAVTLLNSHVGDGSIHVTSSEKNAWNAKQDAISDLATIRSGAAAGASALQPSGNGSNVTATFSTAGSRTDISSGEKLSVLFGKIAKWFADLGTAAFKTLVTAWSSTTSDNNIPSEKLVKDSLDSKQDALPSITGKAGKVLKVNSGATGLEWAPDDNITYSQISRGSGAGLAPGLPSGSGTSKYLREDGMWYTPPHDTYSAGDGLTLSEMNQFSVDNPFNPNGDYSSNTLRANTAVSADNATSAGNYSSGGGIDNALQGKAPKLHIDTQGIYGLAKEGYYGHVKLAKGNISGRAYSDGEAASVGHNHDGSYLKDPQSHTLQWGGTSVIGTYSGNNITLTMPANPFNPNGDYSSNTLRANTAVSADSAQYAVGASNYTQSGSIATKFNNLDSYSALGFRHWMFSHLGTFTPSASGKKVDSVDAGTATTKRRVGMETLFIGNNTGSDMWCDLRVVRKHAVTGESVTLTFIMKLFSYCYVPVTIPMDAAHFSYEFWIYKNSQLATGSVTVMQDSWVLTSVFENSDE